MVTALRIISVALMLFAAALALADEPTPKPQTTKTSTTAPAPKPKAEAKDLAPLPIELPKPVITGTPENIPPGTHAKKPSNKPRPAFLAPKGCVNVAKGKPVTASDGAPIIGEADLVTDGRKEANMDSYVELGPGVQWVQIDLGKPLPIQAVLLWHEHHKPSVVYYDVIVQVSSDKDFIENVRTIYNNDHDNSAGKGLGENWGYFENHQGKLIPAGGVRARYVRLYSNGNTSDDRNRFTEVEVYAVPTKPARKAKAGKKPPRTPTSTKSTAKPNANTAPLPIELPKPVLR